MAETEFTENFNDLCVASNVEEAKGRFHRCAKCKRDRQLVPPWRPDTRCQVLPRVQSEALIRAGGVRAPGP